MSLLRDVEHLGKRCRCLVWKLLPLMILAVGFVAVDKVEQFGMGDSMTNLSFDRAGRGMEAHLQQSSSGKNGQGRLLGDQNSIVLFSFFFFFVARNKSGMIVTLLLVRDRSLSLHGHFDPCRKSEVWWHRHTKERWKFFRRTVTCYGRWALSYVFPPVCKTRHCSSYPNVPQFHFMADSCVCKLQLWGSTK